MAKIIIILFFFIGLPFSSEGQELKKKVFTSDIDNFWKAFDSIQNTDDREKQLHYIRTLYIHKGSEGLKAFMEARNYTAELWVELINNYPKFWHSIRPSTITAKSKANEIEKRIRRLKKLYPQLKEAKIFFTIGGLRSGGTTMEDKVLIGAEIATGNAATNVTEFPDKWLEGVFKNQQMDNIVPLNIHEYVHTQQAGYAQNLLGQAIREGACDFITELVMDKPLQNSYLLYGRRHEKKLKDQFKLDMLKPVYKDWLYNGTTTETVADLGYFMGYAICKSYYNHSLNKKKAIKEIIELNYSDKTEVKNFLKKSMYYSEN